MWMRKIWKQKQTIIYRKTQLINFMIASGDHTQKQTTLYLGELITRTIKKNTKKFRFYYHFSHMFFYHLFTWPLVMGIQCKQPTWKRQEQRKTIEIEINQARKCRIMQRKVMKNCSWQPTKKAIKKCYMRHLRHLWGDEVLFVEAK